MEATCFVGGSGVRQDSVEPVAWTTVDAAVWPQPMSLTAQSLGTAISTPRELSQRQPEGSVVPSAGGPAGTDGRAGRPAATARTTPTERATTEAAATVTTNR